MKTDITQRREDLIKLISMGVPPFQAIKRLAEERRIAVSTLERDWERRNNWLPDFSRLNDPTLLQELLVNLQQIHQKLWLTYTQADNSSAKVGALRELRATIKDIIEILQSTGHIEMAPIRIEENIQIQVKAQLVALLNRLPADVRAQVYVFLKEKATL